MGKINCLRCNFRHTDNGNCTAIGGFCTAVPAAHCPLLRQYLDTRMTPEQCENAKVIIEAAFSDDTSKAERIRELLKADKDGRLVVLPCKVGDTVWSSLDGAKCARECKVDFVNIGNVGTTFVLSAKNGLREQYGVTATAFGKTVFLTREEAEKALEAMKDA